MDDLAKRGAIVANVSIDRGSAEELGVIEDVECLQPELEHFAFMQCDFLLQGHVEVLQAGAVEETAWDVAHLTKIGSLGIFQIGGGNEPCSVKGRLAAPRVSIDSKIAREHDRGVNAVVIDAVGNGAEQGAVRVVVESDGQAGGEVRNPGDFPALRPTVGGAKEILKWNPVVVADDKVLPDIKGR